MIECQCWFSPLLMLIMSAIAGSTTEWQKEREMCHTHSYLPWVFGWLISRIFTYKSYDGFANTHRPKEICAVARFSFESMRNFILRVLLMVLFAQFWLWSMEWNAVARGPNVLDGLRDGDFVFGFENEWMWNPFLPKKIASMVFFFYVWDIWNVSLKTWC